MASLDSQGEENCKIVLVGKASKSRRYTDMGWYVTANI